MIDANAIVAKATEPIYCGDYGRFAAMSTEIAERAVALTLRAVAEEIKLKWMLPERSISDFSMMLDSQAAAIEKGGGINEARKLADENERWCMDESARTIRALCDRVEAADEVIRASEWKSVDWTTNECPYCAANEDHGHKPDCKLAAWLRGGKA